MIPLPGTEIDIGPIKSDHVREALRQSRAVLIPCLYAASGTSKVWFGVCASVVEVEDILDGMASVKSAFRVRLKNMKLNAQGYAESEWERVDDVLVSKEEFSSKEFQCELLDLATIAYIVTRQYEHSVSKNTFLIRSGERSAGGVGSFIDRIAHLLNAPFGGKDMRGYLGTIISEENVRDRLREATEAYRSLLDEDNEFEILYPEEAQTPYATEEDIEKIPGQLFHVLLSSSGEKTVSLIPLPGFLASLRGVGGGVEAYLSLRSTPYFIFDLTDPETGKRGDVGILMRVYAIHRDHDHDKLKVIVEALARVRIPYFPSENQKVTVGTWKPYGDEHLSREECTDRDFLRFCLSLEAISLYVGTLVKYCRSGDPSDINQKFFDTFSAFFDHAEEGIEAMRNRFAKNPKLFAAFIDEQISVLNKFSSMIPEAYTHLYGIAKERSVIARLSLSLVAFEKIIECIVNQSVISHGVYEEHSEPSANRKQGQKAQRTIVGVEGEAQASVLALPVPESRVNDGKLDSHTRSPEAKRLKDFLESKIVGEEGQRRAIDRIVDAYEWYLSPLWRHEIPIFCGLFLGPSGVGKTEIAKKLAEFFFDDEHGLTKIACGDYQEKHEITSKLIGSPPGYIGYDDRPQLGQERIDRYGIEKRIRELEEMTRTAQKSKEEMKRIEEEQENLRLQINPVVFEGGKPIMKGKHRSAEDAVRQPFFSVVLFDEVEKAHPNLRKFLLEVFAEGSITLAAGERTSFHHSFIIMTSNLISRDLADAVSGGNQIGMRDPSGTPGAKPISDDALYRMVMHKIKKVLEPEFLGRIQENIVMFSSLKPHETELIRDRQFAELSSRLQDSFAIILTVEKEVGTFILAESTDHPEYGARLLESKIRHFIEMPLSRLINTGQLKKGDRIKVQLDGVGKEAKPAFYRESSSLDKDGNL